MAVGDEGLLEELGHLGDVGLAHPALDLDGMHGAKLPLNVRAPRPPAGPSRRLGTVRFVARPRSLRARAAEVVTRLAREFPGTAAQLCALEHDGSFQLLVATILSAQCTDERVNMVTPGLFAAYPTPQSLAEAPVEDLEERIRSTGFFRSKAKNLLGMAQGVTERFGGEVPSSMEDLTSLPGVGRKTANVVRSVAMGLPGSPRRHPRGAPHPATGPHRADRSGEGRERDRRPGPARGVGGTEPAAHPPRSQDVSGPYAALWRVRPRRHLSVVAGPPAGVIALSSRARRPCGSWAEVLGPSLEGVGVAWCCNG